MLHLRNSHWLSELILPLRFNPHSSIFYPTSWGHVGFSWDGKSQKSHVCMCNLRGTNGHNVYSRATPLYEMFAGEKRISGCSAHKEVLTTIFPFSPQMDEEVICGEENFFLVGGWNDLVNGKSHFLDILIYPLYPINGKLLGKIVNFWKEF